jgi:hypothetical protein
MHIPDVLNTTLPPPTHITLGAGDGAPFVFRSFVEFQVPAEIIDKVADGQVPWGFEGTIQYADVFGKSHTTGYRGDWNFQTANFDRTETQNTQQNCC